MAKGKINVSVENIFPLIKKFLYSDHEIFLRELISNATDATLKLKHLSNIGEFKDDYGDPIIEVKIDKKNKRLHIIDQGIGMTGDEIKKYINEVAFSGAEEFLEKYNVDDILSNSKIFEILIANEFSICSKFAFTGPQIKERFCVSISGNLNFNFGIY